MKPAQKPASDEIVETKRRLAGSESAQEPPSSGGKSSGDRRRKQGSASTQNRSKRPKVKASVKAMSSLEKEITRRKQLQHDFAEMEARFNALTATFPVAVGISTFDGRFLYINNAYYQVFGYTLEEINQLKAGDLYYDPDDRLAWSATLQEKGVLRDHEVMLKRKDGTPFWALISVSPIQITGTQGYIGSVIDISERKQREEDVRRLNRTLKALSDSNQAMLHTSSETQLLQEACRIVVEDAGFHMAWIGYVMDDERQSVIPVASAGFEQGYLDSLHISLADPLRGSGPTGTAIRTRKPARCNNMLTDPKFAPWRAAALERGYASSLVLPLISGTSAFGAVNIYSRDANGFSDEEESLLVELANDLSYAITTLRLKAESDRASLALGQSEERYRALFNTTSDGVWIHDLDGMIQEVNDAYCAMSGYSREEIIGMPISRLEALESRADFAARIKKLQAKGGHDHFESQHRRKDGSLFDLDITALYLEREGGRIAIFVRDITEHKRMEAELRQVEARRQVAEAMQAERQRFFAVLESMPVMICLLTSDYHVAFANRLFRTTFGEADGRHCYEYCYGQSQPCDFCESFDVLKTGQPHHWEISIPDGRVIDAHDVPFTDVDGTPMVLEMDVDITDRRKSEQALIRYQEQLEQMVSERTASLETEVEQRKKAQEASRQNEAMLRAILDQMPSGVTVRDAATGELILANNQAREIMGQLADNVSQFSIYRGLHPDGRPYDMGEWPVNRSMSTGEVVNSEEIECERRDGSRVFLSMSSAPIRNAAGEVTTGVSIFHDITARKRVEQRLSYLASFPGRNPNPIVEVDRQSRLNFVNKTTLDAFPDLVELGTTHAWLSGLDPIFVQFQHGDANLVTRDVRVGDHWYQQSIFYIDAEQVLRIYGTDITVRKQAEEALRLSEQRYRNIVETADEGIVLTLPNGEYTYVNQQMANMLGYTTGEMLGKTGLDFSYDPQPSQIQQLRAELHRGSVVRGEFKFRRKDGSVLWSMYNATPIFNEQGEHSANLAMHTDITERKLAEEALRQAHDNLERRVQERTQDLNVANTQLRAEVDQRQKAQTELESSLQELQVIEEELRNNNDMLLDAQKVLGDERQRYRDLFEFAPDAYLVTDTRGIILEANQSAAQLLSISHRNLIGKPLIVFINQDDHLMVTRLFGGEELQQSNRALELRLIPRHKAELIASVKIAFAKDQASQVTLRWTIRDITARKQAEETIRQNALRNAVLSEISQSLTSASLDEKAILDIVVKTTARLVGDCCVITEISPDGQWLEPAAWSHKKPEAIQLMTTLYGATRSPVDSGPSGRVFRETQSLLVKEFIPADPQSSIPSAYQEYLDAIGISSLLVVPVRLGAQTIGTLGITRDRGGQPYTEDDQSLLEILASRTGQAIHNARLYQELQAALRKELETHDQLVQSEKFAVIGRLLASITHEINNPLQTIKNCLYLSQVDTPPGTPAYDALGMAATETNRLSNLVAQLREIYRPPTLGLSKPVSLPTLVSEVQVLLASYLQDKHIRWEVTPPGADLFSSLSVEGVPDQLKQVFLNICLNAIDAMESQGGSINIGFRADLNASQVGVSFRDTGPGLPAEVKAKIFEPFTTTKEKGLGLGLAICYDIIQKHRGHIEVESEPGLGAAFTIWLPARSLHS